MLAALRTAPDGEEKEGLVAKLVSHYLTDSAVVDGKLLAADLLDSLDAPRFTELSEALRFETTNPAGSGNRPGHGQSGGRAASRAGRGRPDEVATTTGRTSAALTALRRARGSYFAQVRALLRPLGGDSAIAAALLADSTLRTPLWQMANDTLRWDCVAGRAALSQYLGYRFPPLRDVAPDAATAGRAVAGSATLAARPIRAAGRVTLAPNPAGERVTITYEQAADTSGELRLFDGYGRLVRTVSMRGAAGAAELSLTGLRAGLYYYAHWAGELKGMTGTLLVQP